MRPLKARHGGVNLPLVETCVEEVLRRLALFSDVENSEAFIEQCVTEAKARGIGWWQWPRRREYAIRDGIAATIRHMPFAKQPLGEGIREGVLAAIQRLKDEMRILVTKP